MHKVLSLFSGGLAGLCERGIEIAGLQQQFQVKQFIEYAPYRQHLLRQNFPGIAIWDDIRSYTAKPGTFDVICGGSPCQQNSLANPKRNGLHGERSGLWWEMHRLINEVKPRVVLWENPDGCRHPTKDDSISPLGYVLWSLNEIGYSTQWSTISASEVGAPHKRERVFLIAHANDDEQISRRAVQSTWSGQIGDALESIRTNNSRLCEQYKFTGVDHGYSTELNQIRGLGWWGTNPYKGEMEVLARSQKDRKHRVSILGDGCTPQQSAVCWKYINYLMS
ncbi:methylase [Nodularia phage vB_NpeS-2AV2]|jgi:DNA (cytosine-5)-methyltransferase 1|uniref:DNA (cytosine-5-)-methyltransferase n=3 Tax=Ravarandavirus TaxID=2843444 RepID=A0A482MK50_9CAUD|nr:DNA methyltransferase [Nodularia phage vB_NpeS-2AV2]YP_009844983.1 DNA methyltransferase [Nodularia phage vB_NspS-kac68v161]ALY07612.1 methylase [Nodularia phage vB_NpeS-2AV2]QBQ73824.1 DNA cytosine methyltransferase [Nodularia phage vB_NspS-kac68v161]QBQ74019.1 DNA cytosine methyltransferase [Nodularia phage vB_NspS-kac68v162]